MSILPLPNTNRFGQDCEGDAAAILLPRRIGARRLSGLRSKSRSPAEPQRATVAVARPADLDNTGINKVARTSYEST